MCCLLAHFSTAHPPAITQQRLLVTKIMGFFDENKFE